MMLKNDRRGHDHMKIRAVLLDMDGTLLGRSQVAVSVKNMRAIQRALKKGLIVIPCTGRVMDMLPPQLLTQEGLRYFITSHGARVFDRETGETIYQDLIPPQQAAGLMTLLQGRGLYNEIAANATIYLERDIAALAGYPARSGASRLVHARPLLFRARRPCRLLCRRGRGD